MPTKVIIVSFHNHKRHPMPFTFGSIPAIFSKFTEQEIGTTMAYLSHCRQLIDSHTCVTPHCSIYITHLIRSPKG